MSQFIQSQSIPTSLRSREAIERVRPRLQKLLAQHELQWGVPIFIRIFKQEKELELWGKGEHRYILVKTYPVSTCESEPLGPKKCQGDGKAPEGYYFVTADRLYPWSSFHLAINIGYPNLYDRLHDRSGSYIMIHGSGASMGCFTMTDAHIEEIFALADGALRNMQTLFRIHIFPFRMTTENLDKYKDSQWLSFWQNLKEGFDFFENRGYRPPEVGVNCGRYVFTDSSEILL